MTSMTRRCFLRGAVATPALIAGTRAARAQDERLVSAWEGGEVGNALFRLALSPREGLRNTRLTHSSGLVLADGDYSYSFERPAFHEARASKDPDGADVIALRGATQGGQLEVLHEFRVPHNQPWIEEQITLTNRGPAPSDLQNGRCGFALPLSISQGQVVGDWAPFKFIAVPFRRDPNGGRAQYADFFLSQVLTEQFPS